VKLETRFRLLFEMPFMEDVDLPLKEGIIDAWECEFLREVRFRWFCRGIIPSPKQERVLFGIAAKLDGWWVRNAAARAWACPRMGRGGVGRVREGLRTARCARKQDMT